MPTAGSRVKRARQRAGMSRQALARAVGISEETLRSYETGRRALPADLLPALALNLGIDVGWLVGAPGSSQESIASVLTAIEGTLRRLQDQLSDLRRQLAAGPRRPGAPK